YPPARGHDAWLLEREGSGGLDGLRQAAARLIRDEPDTQVFVEAQRGGEGGEELERAGFRRRAARIRGLGRDRWIVPAHGTMPSFGDLAKAAIAGVVPGERLIVHGDRAGRSLRLTFDDGPDPERTPRVLDRLAELGATATFFVIGANAEKRPDLVRRIVDEGHALGHHSFTHSSPPRTSATKLMDEVRRTRELLAGIVGFAPRLFRPPRGQLTGAKLARLWLAGQKVVLWNVDPRDFACSTAADLRAVLVGRTPEAGDIVLLHDDSPHVLPVLPDLARAVTQRGLALRMLPT